MIITGRKFSKPEMSRVINGDKQIDTGPERVPRKRLDHILVELHPEFNRSTLQNFIRSGYVTVAGKEVLRPNAEIELVASDGGEFVPPEIKLIVPERKTPPDAKTMTIFEDENVLVLNKPAGMLSMAKGEFTLEPTLEDYGLLVHRLDRDTSGVVILGKNPAVQTYLRKQFQDRKTHKTYIAIVEGRPKLEEAKIDLPIARNIKHPTTFLVDPNGKPSQTFYKVLETVEKNVGGKKKTYSLVELRPVTGRTHQLRVHLKYLGHPIVGDKVYGDTEAERLFLHAKTLEITIPEGDRREFIAPVPKEFREFLDVL